MAMEAFDGIEQAREMVGNEMGSFADGADKALLAAEVVAGCCPIKWVYEPGLEGVQPAWWDNDKMCMKLGMCCCAGLFTKVPCFHFSCWTSSPKCACSCPKPSGCACQCPCDWCGMGCACPYMPCGHIGPCLAMTDAEQKYWWELQGNKDKNDKPVNWCSAAPALCSCCNLGAGSPKKLDQELKLELPGQPEEIPKSFLDKFKDTCCFCCPGKGPPKYDGAEGKGASGGGMFGGFGGGGGNHGLMHDEREALFSIVALLQGQFPEASKKGRGGGGGFGGGVGGGGGAGGRDPLKDLVGEAVEHEPFNRRRLICGAKEAATPLLEDMDLERGPKK